MAKKALAAQESSGHAGLDISTSAVRTCIGCRKADARDQLIRLVRSTNNSGTTVALVDVHARMPGRGAWLHPGLECWRLAIKRRAIGRALPGVTDVRDVELLAEQDLRKQA
ncbi:putative RNA-binding protein YlxR (DUF448 family) [Arthrobacter stackebrandtii]|uniref:RNA-binding protein YlxR (DUF448 family) n=1 Tax=Arthrobacter stackebrandtii TaxID=272161 RepID=A0ABS4YR81_9MICC|nr:putative RNA-binding protein YlxR (DUF448 family) [Arthrobacter stackebrandtii]